MHNNISPSEQIIVFTRTRRRVNGETSNSATRSKVADPDDRPLTKWRKRVTSVFPVTELVRNFSPLAYLVLQIAVTRMSYGTDVPVVVSLQFQCLRRNATKRRQVVTVLARFCTRTLFLVETTAYGPHCLGQKTFNSTGMASTWDLSEGMSITDVQECTLPPPLSSSGHASS